jgi:hypothetical protein
MTRIAATISNKKVSKSTLSMFLRTGCDKELFLSLHDKSTMEAAGLPVPVKRPGIGVLSVEGRAFEVARNEQIARLFPSILVHRRSAAGYEDVDLKAALAALTVAPKIILQGRFSISGIRETTLANIGLSSPDAALIPPIADFIPDILVVRPAVENDTEVRADGSRRAVDASNETRLAITILDVKHTSEANPSYCSEIALYAVMLANWINADASLRSRFFVSVNAYLWTRFKQGESELDQLERAGGSTTQQLLDALFSDSEDANLRYYLSAIRRFFEDVARVIKVGDARDDGWSDLEWHVSGTCGSCDWLGDTRHSGADGRHKISEKPEHYCMPCAKATGHLSLVPGVTKGAKQVLASYAVVDAAALASAHNHPAFQQHTTLKKDAKQLPARTTAVLTGVTSNDAAAAIASLAKSANLLLFASINFDSSAGMLTGLALSGVATTFTAGQSPTRFAAESYLVDQKTLDAEWIALEGFLTKIADCIERTERLVTNSPTGQVHFWEERQFKELCCAMGRHLPKVLALANRKAKALAWLFPSDDFVPSLDSIESASIVMVEDIVRRVVFTPTPHVVTLFDTVEAYNNGFPVTVRDPYYREYLNNGIPRERIYELWSNAAQVKRGTLLLPRNNVVVEYSDALARQARALESVCSRLRTDYASQIRTQATRIPASVPRGTSQVAFDAKLWIWWDSLDFSASQLESHIRLAMDGERLEATYEAIVLKNGHAVRPGVYAFDVAPSSAEAKFKEDAKLAIGKIGRPGLPLERARNIIRAGAPAFAGDGNVFNFPLWSAISGTLISFDRVALRAEVRIECGTDATFVPYLIANARFSLLDDIFLLESKSPAAFDWSRTSSVILRDIGDPAIATPDANAAAAMGISPAARRGTRSPITPAARVLWEPDVLERTAVASSHDAASIAAFAQATHSLNPSQTSAVAHGAERALTVIWGPPGTGKTNTLAALIGGLAHHAAAQGQALKILVTGPTYKAVEEVMARTAEFVTRDALTPVKMFMAYSKGRTPGNLPSHIAGNIDYHRISLDTMGTAFHTCVGELQGAGVVVVGTQIRQARRFAKGVSGGSTDTFPVFDVVIIDESSQVPVSHSLSALGSLKPNARAVIAGDHLQMPPITSLEPPANAAYLVGSIQTYLKERKFNTLVDRCVLNENYRSGEHIVDFARKIGYPASLTAASAATRLRFMGPLPQQSAYPVTLPWTEHYNEILSPDNAVVTVLHQDATSSQGNHFEARVVAGVVWMLRQVTCAQLEGRGAAAFSTPTAEEFWESCVGVVTPHRAQRALVLRELEVLFPGEKNLMDSAVDTVERFQGGQRHTIIVTYGVADTDVIGGEEAFLMQLERTNVAVSRAMAKCIMVMPHSLAAYIPEDKRALATAFAVKDYVDEFCNIRLSTVLHDGPTTRVAEIRYRR